MIYRKTWGSKPVMGMVKYQYEGWFLFGFIPLYVRRYA